MPRPTMEDLPAVQAAVVPFFESWSHDHSGDVMTPRPYDPADPYQKVENVRFGPSPEISLGAANFIGRQAVGNEIYDQLLKGLYDQGAIDLAVERSRDNKNTLYASLHLHDVRDTGVTHNSVYVASGGEQEVAEINDMIVNPMVAYLNFGERAAYEILRASGGVDEMLPYEAAGRYGMTDKGLRLFLMEMMQASLLERLERGVAIHWSLPGTRSKEVTLKKDRKALQVQRVSSTIADFAVKRVGRAIPIPMNLPAHKVEVLPNTPLKSVEDVHRMMEEMTDAVSEETGQRVTYQTQEEAEAATRV